MQGCPSDEQFEGLLAEQLGAADRDAVETHVEGCPTCQQRLAELADGGTRSAGLLPPGAVTELQPPPDTEFLRRLKQSPPWPTPPLANEAASAETLTFEGHAPAPPADWPIVAGYEVVGELGRGGMGVVYRARQEALDRVVALKMVLSGPHADPAELARFQAEAQAAANLRHPNIVAIYEVGEYQGRHFFSMDYVEGQSLAELARRQPLSAVQAAECLRTVAQAIQSAHDHGFLHRDLKPSNILIDAAGQPHVTDFGLAKRIESNSELTATGTVLGTPSYMPPEQALGRHDLISPTADIYALGATLYDVLTGRPPFRGATAVETLRQVIDAEPAPPRLLNPSVPRDLETICLKCLQKESGKRYTSATALADDLQRFLEGRPIQARPVGQAERLWRWARRNPVVASLTAAVSVLIAAVAIGSSLVALDQRQRRTAAEVKAEETRKELVRLQVARGVALLDEGDLFGSLSWFADALKLDEGDPRREEMHRERLAAVLRQCPKLAQIWFHEGPVHYAEFSPDGRRVVTASEDGSARVWNADTGDPETPPLEHDGAVYRAWFDADGRRVLTASDDGSARVWNATTGKLMTKPMTHKGPVRFAAFRPQGDCVVTASRDKTVRIWNATTGAAVTQALNHDQQVLGAVFSPDGELLVTTAGDTAQVWSTATGQGIGKPLKHGTSVIHASFRPDGRVLTVSGDGTSRLWDAATGERVILSLGLGVKGGTSAQLSPDGRRIAIAGSDPISGVWDLATGEPVTLLFKQAGRRKFGQFTSDGGRVTTASADGTARVWDATTGDPVTPPLRHGAAVEHASFSPDGRHLVTACGDGLARVWDLAAGHPTQFDLPHPRRVEHASFSPDGRHAATACADGSVQVWNVATGQAMFPKPLQDSRGFAHCASFSPDGKRLVSAVGRGDGETRVLNTVTGEPHLVLKHAKAPSYASFSPDGRYILTAGPEGAQLWRGDTGELVRTIVPGRLALNHACFSPDSRRLVTAAGGDRDGEIQIWNALTGEAITPPMKHKDSVHDASFSPDGRRAVSASNDQTAQVWDAATGEPVGRPLEHGGGLRSASFSPNGHQVVTAGFDKTARVWDAATGIPVTPPLKHVALLTGASFSPDGRRVVTSSEDGSARVWDVATGEPLTPPLRQRGFVQHAAFSPDGQVLITAGGDNIDGMARLYRLSPSDLSVDDLVLLAWVLTGQRTDAARRMVPLDTAEVQAAWQRLRPGHSERFVSSEEEIAAWERQQAEPRWLDWASRGDVHAMGGEHDKAALFYARAVTDAEAPSYLWRYYAVHCLYLGDLERYRRACAGMLDRFGKTEEAETARRVARTCVLGPNALADLEQVVQLAEELAAARPEDALCSEDLGFVLYRAGRFEAAIAEIGRAIKLHGGRDAPLAWLFLAMAHHRLGHADDARQWLDKGVRWIDENYEIGWLPRLTSQIVRREAEALLREAVDNPKK
jgi:WD40 repeat protein/tetratricopeptide (TPR) repeat protein